MRFPTRPARVLGPWLPLVLVAAGVLLLAGCGGDYPQTTLEPRGEAARISDDVFMTTVKWAAVVFVLVELGLLLAIFKFRGKPTDPEPAQVHGNTMLEIVWTAIPAVILAFIAVPTVRAIARDVEKDDQKFSAIVMGVVRSAQFQMRVK